MPAALLALALATIALLPASGHAQNPYCIEMPCGINLVGTTSGVPDAHGEFRIRVGLQPLCTPVSGALITLDFNACQPDIKLCRIQENEQGSCPFYITSTDDEGYATIRLVGGATNTTGATPGYTGLPCTNGCLRVMVNNQNITGIGVAAYDQNGSGGVNPADTSVWLTDSFSQNYYARSDFDFSGELAPPDLSMLLQVSLDGQSFQSCNFYCE